MSCGPGGSVASRISEESVRRLELQNVRAERIGRPLFSLSADAAAIPSTPDAGGHGIRVKDLRAWYGARLAIEGVSIDFAPRHVTAIIGPSGCGKSTLIRCLNRMHEVLPGARAEGVVELDGQNIYAAGVDPVQVRRVVGMVFQKPNPFPMMTIFENVVAGLRLQGAGGGRSGLEMIAERALCQAALFDEVKDVWKTASGISLSGGQQQRLCIARTLAVEPDVILMDEPASALDPIATYRIEELIGELKRQYTIVVVTHNMQQASRVSDYTAFMLAEEDRIGRPVEFGPTARMFTNPTEQRTEDYITGRFG
jgi:phosphate transport system ATP-binding protein